MSPLIMRGNIDTVLPFNFGLCVTSFSLENSDVFGSTCLPCSIVFARVLAMKFQLESPHFLVTMRIVTYNLYTDLLSNVVFVFGKDDCRRRFRRSHSKEAANFIFQFELKIESWEYHSWSKDVNLRFASECR